MAADVAHLPEFCSGEMYHMGHRLFTFISAVSLVLFLATCVMWVRSYRHGFEVRDITVWTATGECVPVQWTPVVPTIGESNWNLDWFTNRVVWQREVVIVNPPHEVRPCPESGIGRTIRSCCATRGYVTPYGGWAADTERDILADGGFVRGGFGYSRANGTFFRHETNPWGTDIVRRAMVPVWFLAASFIPLPAFWTTRRLRTTKRSAEGLCLTCGYDLRATPDRCPECGTVPQAVTA
jgi:hypothetical protein